MQTGERNLNSSEPGLFCHLSAADEQVWKAFVLGEAFFKRQSALEQEIASLRDPLAVADSTQPVDFGFKPASARE